MQAGQTGRDVRGPGAPGALDELHPRDLRPVADGRYAWTATPCDVRRRVLGVVARWNGIRDVDLSSISWRHTTRNGEVTVGGRDLRLIRPMWIPAGVEAQVVLTLEGVWPGAWLQVTLLLDAPEPR